MFRGAEPSEAQLHEGASEPAVDTCLSPVWHTVFPSYSIQIILRSFKLGAKQAVRRSHRANSR